MATLAYPYSVRDSANTATDNRKSGLTPTVSAGKTLAASPATVLAATVSVVEVGAGDYVALYDAEANGDASFPVDWGSSLANPNDRYGTLVLTRDPGRVLASLPATAAGSSGGLPLIGSAPLTSLDAAVSSRMATFALPANFAALGISSGGKVGGVALVDALTTYTGNTPQSGDAFARIGAAGAGLTGLGDARLANLDAAVSTRSTYAGGDTSGTTTLLARLTSTRATALDNLDAAVSTRSTYAGGAVASVADRTGYKLAADGLDAVPVAAPSGPAATFREMVVQLWRRRFAKVTKTTTQIRTYADDGTTVVTTQAIADDGAGDQTLGAAT